MRFGLGSNWRKTHRASVQDMLDWHVESEQLQWCTDKYHLLNVVWADWCIHQMSVHMPRLSHTAGPDHTA